MAEYVLIRSDQLNMYRLTCMMLKPGNYMAGRRLVPLRMISCFIGRHETSRLYMCIGYLEMSRSLLSLVPVDIGKLLRENKIVFSRFHRKSRHAKRTTKIRIWLFISRDPITSKKGMIRYVVTTAICTIPTKISLGFRTVHKNIFYL